MGQKKQIVFACILLEVFCRNHSTSCVGAFSPFSVYRKACVNRYREPCQPGLPQPTRYFRAKSNSNFSRLQFDFSFEDGHRRKDSLLQLRLSAATEANTSDSPNIEGRTKSKRVLLSRALLSICVFLIGYRFGVSRPNSSVLTSASSPRRFFALSTLLVVLVARDVWRSVPAWAKPGLVRRAVEDTRLLFGMPVRLVQGRKREKKGDISDLGILGGKIQALWEVVQRRLPPESLEHINLEASILALLQVFEMEKRVHPSTSGTSSPRDERFAACGSILTSAELKGLDKWMDLADAAYDEFPPEQTLASFLDERDYHLLKHDKTLLPGYLGHYVAVHKTKKEAVIGVKGTSGLEDLITDMCGAAIPYNLDTDKASSNSTIRAHEGVLLSSVRLANDLQPLVERFLLPQGFKIVFVGHSLGAAASSLVAVLLRARLVELQTSTSQKLQVYAFASPPILDLATAKSCTEFVTTVVNNGDMITRCNAGPVLVTIEVLKTVHARLRKLLAAVDVPSGRKQKQSEDPPVSLAKTLLLLQRLQKKKESKDDSGKCVDARKSIISSGDFERAIDEAIEVVGDDDDDQLYVAGKVILMYRDEGLLASEVSETEASDGDNHTEEIGSNRAILVESTASVLRYLELDTCMLDDHMAPSYKAGLARVCKE